MSAKKIADFIFENTGKGVNYAMRKLGIAKSEIDGLTPNQLKLYLAEKAKGSYKGRTKARDSDTGKLVVGGGTLATLASIWDEIDPTKVKKMGDGTLRADERKTNPRPKVTPKPKSIPKGLREGIAKDKKKVAPKVEDKKKQLMMKEKYSGKDSKVKFNAKGGMMKKYSMGGMTKKGKK
jgi:hypothetical protein